MYPKERRKEVKKREKKKEKKKTRNQICWFKRFSVTDFFTKAFPDYTTGMASRSLADKWR